MQNSFSLIWKDETVSTNNDAESLCISDGIPRVIASLCQSGGKGQGDHLWHSARGKNLTFSICVPMGSQYGRNLPASESASISRLVPVTVREFLKSRFGIEPMIKYPNDILTTRGKIAGILIRNQFTGDSLSRTVIGIGLNVNETDFPSDIPSPTSVALEIKSAEDIDTSALLNDYLNYFFGYFPRLFSAAGRQSVAKDYLSGLRSEDIIKAGF